jgi:hypothetical protein
MMTVEIIGIDIPGNDQHYIYIYIYQLHITRKHSFVRTPYKTIFQTSYLEEIPML